MSDDSKKSGLPKESVDSLKVKMAAADAGAANRFLDQIHSTAGTPGAKDLAKDKTHTAASKKPGEQTEYKKPASDASDKHTSSQKHEIGSKRVTDDAGFKVVVAKDDTLSKLAEKHLQFDKRHSLIEKANAIVQMNADRFGHPGKSQDQKIHGLQVGETLLMPKTARDIGRLATQHNEELLQLQKVLAEKKRQEEAEHAAAEKRAAQSKDLKGQFKDQLHKMADAAQQHSTGIREHSGFLGTMGNVLQDTMGTSSTDKNPLAKFWGQHVLSKDLGLDKTVKDTDAQFDDNAKRIQNIQKEFKELDHEKGARWDADFKKVELDIAKLEGNAKAINAIIGRYAQSKTKMEDGITDVAAGVGGGVAATVTAELPGLNLAVGAGVGAAIKAGLKHADAASVGRHYDIKDLRHDVLHGGLAGGATGAGALAGRFAGQAAVAAGWGNALVTVAEGSAFGATAGLAHSVVSNLYEGSSAAYHGKDPEIVRRLGNVAIDAGSGLVMGAGGGAVVGRLGGLTSDAISTTRSGASAMARAISARLFKPTDVQPGASGALASADFFATAKGWTNNWNNLGKVGSSEQPAAHTGTFKNDFSSLDNGSNVAHANTPPQIEKMTSQPSGTDQSVAQPGSFKNDFSSLDNSSNVAHGAKSLAPADKVAGVTDKTTSAAGGVEKPASEDIDPERQRELEILAKLNKSRQSSQPAETVTLDGWTKGSLSDEALQGHSSKLQETYKRLTGEWFKDGKHVHSRVTDQGEVQAGYQTGDHPRTVSNWQTFHEDGSRSYTNFAAKPESK